MLKRVEIEGFKSFKNNVVIDFEKTKYTGLEDTNTFKNGILKGAVFFGSNASGKSTVLEAISFLFETLVGNALTRYDHLFCAFSKEESFKLKYDFVFGTDHIRYEIERIKSGKKKHQFFVENLKINDQIFMERFEASAKRISEGKSTFYSDLDPNVLFLRTEYFNKGFNEKCIKDLFDFAQSSVYLNMFRTRIAAASNNLELRRYLEEFGPARLNKFLEENNFVHRIEYIKVDTKGKESTSLSNLSNTIIAIRRTDIDNVMLEYSDESDGTINLFNILPSFLQCLNKGSLLLIDEFCSGFHNELEELLIRYFFKKSKKSQIFVVTHSTNVLSNTLFRPDQMFKIDFVKGSGSQMFRISNSQPRPGQNIEKMYLGNAFGTSKGFIDKDEA
ncbi:MAG: AAA family ATPase [Acidaminobacter sp.]|uniref:AAA family ATPase n=1 Tax=Acidaminobacter sp. TaxID=1872102 RepID=UPI0013814AF5|nr:ATP-binding protein [Acidaminobacter sp.]MZQ99457.1 AAA family ATPase [Acidaminobacter sp.]